MQESKTKRFFACCNNIILIRNGMVYKNCNYILLGITGLLCFSMSLRSEVVDRYNDKRYCDRVLGSLVGGAYGDALGRPTEGLASLELIKEIFSPDGIESIKSLKLIDCARDESRKLVVPYTDDTGMTIPLFKVLIEARQNNFDVNTTMDKYARFLVVDMRTKHGWSEIGRRIGHECEKRVIKLKSKINNWFETSDREWWAVGKGSKAGEEGEGGGCGSLMRVHPCGLVFAHDPKKAEEYAVAQSTLTHSHPFALAACAALAVGTVLVLRDEDPNKTVETMIKVAEKYDKKTAGYMEDAFSQALDKKGEFQSVDEAITGSQKFYMRYKGLVAHEAIAAIVYAFTLYPDDVKSAILLSANTPGDSDSIASMTGAFVGARTGFSGQLLDEDLRMQLNLKKDSVTVDKDFYGQPFLGGSITGNNGQIVKLEGLDHIKKLAQQLVDVQKKYFQDFQEFTLNDEKFEFIQPTKSDENSY